MFKCSKCNSTEVEELMWVNMNTGEESNEAETGEFYCNSCESHTDVIWEDQDGDVFDNPQSSLEKKDSKEIEE